MIAEHRDGRLIAFAAFAAIAVVVLAAVSTVGLALRGRGTPLEPRRLRRRLLGSRAGRDSHGRAVDEHGRADDVRNDRGMMGDAMRIVASDQQVASGTVSLRVTNVGGLVPSGDYELVCNLAGHYAAGMYTDLHVN